MEPQRRIPAPLPARGPYLTLAIAHRGASAVAPENTLAAFDAALDLGADMIEVDLQMTADGVPVASHDATLERTGRPAGYGGGFSSVASLTLDQVKRHDAGSWFNEAFPQRADPRFRGLTTPTLAEIFVRYGRYTRMFLEVKHPTHPGMTGAIGDMVRDFGLRDVAAERALVIGSFDPAVLQRIGDDEPALSLVRLMPRGAEPATLVASAEELRSVHAVGCHVADVTLDLLIATRSTGLGLYVWTVNDKPEMKRLLALEVDGIMTDHPDLLRGLIPGGAPRAGRSGSPEDQERVSAEDAS